MPFSWNDCAVFFLIDKVEESSFIWDAKQPLFFNKIKKNEFWVKMVEELNLKYRNTGTERFRYADTLKKWNNMKAYFFAEHVRLLRARKLGSVNEQSNWKFFKKMMFLKETALQIRRPAIQQNSHLIIQEDANVPLELANYDDDNCNSNLIIEDTDHKYANTSISEFSTPKYIDLDCGEGSFSESIQDHDSLLLSPTNSEEGSCATKRPKHIVNENMVEKILQSSEDLLKIIKDKAIEKKTPIHECNFGQFLEYEILKLDPDLQIEAKSRCINLVLELHTKQLQRKNK